MALLTNTGRAQKPLLRLPRQVWLLGLVSLFTDTASEAIYPLLPVFLTTVLGAGAVSLGLIEGVAEGANSVLKLLSGRLSDRWGTRKPVVIAGYLLSSVTRPLIGLAGSWAHVLTVRFVDRVGKGVRGAPRDALLAAAATPDTRGRVFGFHRAMDHIGAIIGPLVASLFLLIWPGQYRALFLATIVPGAAAVWCLFFVRETPVHTRADSAHSDTSSAGAALEEAGRPRRTLPRRYYALLAVLVLFTLGNSADAFLLLRLSEVGVSVAFIPLLWALHHVVKAGVSILGGSASDRYGRRGIIGAGWLLYALVYAGFAVTATKAYLVALFLGYGVYYGLAEGTEKALVADLAPSELRGTAFGWYYASLGIGALLSSVGFGIVWTAFGAAAAFSMGAALAMAATLLLFVLVPRVSRGQAR